MTPLTLVTGAAGFAGSHLLDLLVSQSCDVVAWHRSGSEVADARPGVRWRAVDLLHADAVTHAVAADRPLRVFHCAGAAHVGQAWERTTETLATNVLGTHHLLHALARHSPEARVLVTSSAAVYAPSHDPMHEGQPLRPASPYGLSKLAQEMTGLGAVGGPAVFIARPFNHIGPRQSPTFVSSGFARQIAEIEAGLKPPHIAVGNLEARRDLMDVRDTVRAYAAIVDRGIAERPYNVCSGRAIAVHDLLNSLLAKAQVPIDVVIDPSRYRPNDTPIVVGDGRRIEQELGWRPNRAIDETLDDLLDYWRQRVARA